MVPYRAYRAYRDILYRRHTIHRTPTRHAEDLDPFEDQVWGREEAALTGLATRRRGASLADHLLDLDTLLQMLLGNTFSAT